MSDCTDRAIIWPILFEMCNHCCGPGDQSGLVHRAADVVGEFGSESLAHMNTMVWTDCVTVDCS